MGLPTTLTDIDPVYLWEKHWNDEIEQQKFDTRTDVAEWRRAGRVSKDKPNKEDYEWWTSEGARQASAFRTFLAERLAAGWTIPTIDGEPAIEWGGTATFGKVEVKFYIDLIFELPDGTWVIFDYKTGARQPMPLQLGGYKACLEVTVPKAVKDRAVVGAYLMTREMKVSDFFPLDHYTPALFESYYGMLDRGITSKVFIPHVSDMCKGCGVQQFCSAVGGTFAHQFDPSHPDYMEAK